VKRKEQKIKAWISRVKTSINTNNTSSTLQKRAVCKDDSVDEQQEQRPVDDSDSDEVGDDLDAMLQAAVAEGQAGEQSADASSSPFTPGAPLSIPCPNKIDRVSADLDPREFWERFVSRRQPCIVVGVLSGSGEEASWKGNEWDNGRLTELAGDSVVQVEERHRAEGLPFGRGTPKKEMAFSSFLSRLESGDDSFYLTTQRIPEAKDGSPAALCGAPLNKMGGEFPLRPRLLGNLVPSQCNVWMGNNRTEGSSSGLHHDFHENLYVLLRGRKSFRLHSPAAYRDMYTSGKVTVAYPNGLLVYKGAVRSDGAPISHEEAAKELTQAENALDRLAVGGPLHLSSSKASSSIAERRLRDAEMMLDASMAEGMDSESDEAGGEGEEGKAVGGDPSLPDNFCRVQPGAMNRLEIRNGFPRYLHAPLCEVDISAGEMLYLPTGWFHEVTSFAEKERAGSKLTGGKRGHMAFNYWMHPPDNNSFKNPYREPFWEKRWAKGKPAKPSLHQGRLASRVYTQV